MNDIWPMVTLGEVLHLAIETVKVDPLISYPIAGVYSFGRGLLARSPILGTETTYNILHRLHRNDFVLSQLKGWEGALARVPDKFDGWFLSPQFPTFRAVLDQLDIAYLDWYCKQAGVWEELKNKSRGMGARRDSVSPAQFLSLRIPLPPLEEQRCIVARIEELATKIEEARGLRREAVEETESLMDICSSKIFIEASRNGTTRLDDVANLERGKFSHRPRNDPRFFEGHHPWIQIAEIESSNKYIRKWRQTLNDAGLAISRKFPKGTLLVSIAATIGAVGILEFDCCVPDSIVAVTPKQGTDSEYLYYFLSHLRSYLERVAPQSAQKNINLEILSLLPIPPLPLPEQRSIVAYLDDLQAKVDALKQLQAETQAELDALMPSVLDRAFRGELV